MRILIVEDEALIAFGMGEVLHEAGHAVSGYARDEYSALRMATQDKPDLALVDLHLARGSSGATVARLLRQRHGIPSIYVSGNPAECHTVGRMAGGFGCLAKPFNDGDLVGAVAVVEQVMKGRYPQMIPVALELYLIL
jgi:DNA-binding response OmpR family regulator